VRIGRRIVQIAMALGFLASTALPAMAADPTATSVTLADGRILPPAPAEMMQPSVQGSMLLEHPDLPAGLTDEASSPSTAPSGPAGTITGSPQLLAAGTSSIGPGGVLPNGLRKEVLGFLPYWMLDASTLASLRYDLVSTIAYFSIGATSDGHLVQGTSTGWKGWSSDAMTGVIQLAHARGVRVVPTVTLMSWSGDYTALGTLLTTPANRAQLISEIRGIIAARGADGVNIDFEPVPTSLRDDFTTFVRELKAGLAAGGGKSYLTVDTMAGAASWATGYDVAALTATGAADALMVMAYDFSWSGSSRAGGVSPLKSPYIFDATDAVAAYLKLTPGSKLIWGIPYYGRTWPTQTNALNSLTCRATSPPVCPDALVSSPSGSKAYFYTGALKQATTYGRKWDNVGGVPWYAWYDTPNKTWQQGYYDDPQSLDLKYRLVNTSGMAGIGIWTLLMDAGRDDLWNVIHDRFARQANRIAGSDRYATAAAVSAAFFSPNVPVAFIATGADFPDALAAGPAAAKLGGPLLLVKRDEIPAATAAELTRLKPQTIVVMGGTGAVSASVATKLAPYTSGAVTRVAGTDRYQTAAALSAAYFETGTSVAFIATGANYPDALAGAAYAATIGSPVLLTDKAALPGSTMTELQRLKPGRIVILGGTGAVSDAVRNALAAYTSGGVTRISGSDRYETSVAISKAAFATDLPNAVFIATGLNFPDGLAGAAAAGAVGAPLLLVRPDTLPATVATELGRLNPQYTYLLGMEGAISNTVLKQIRALWD
jgi:putative cell wall-binding protein/spore germination protein YaaH